MANIELDGVNKKIKVDSGDLTLDVPGDIVLDADGGDVVFADGGTNLLKVTNSSSDVVLQPQVDTKDIVFKQYDGTVVATVEDNATFNIPASKLAIGGTAVTSTAAELNILDGVTSTAAELNIMDGVTSTTAELNILDGVTATAAEINLIDGNTARGTTAIADGDGVLINDAGTMRQTTVETLKTYMGGGTNTPLFFASLAGDQTVANSTYTKINFNREVLDSNSKYSTTDMRFSPGETGYYFFQITSTVETAIGNSDIAYFMIYKNGTSIAINPIHRAHVAGNNISTLFIDQATNANDYYEAYFQHNTGGNVDVGYESGSSALSYWFGYKLIS